MQRPIDRHKVRSIVWQYYLFSGCFTTALSFIFSTYSVFLTAKGFDLLQMNLVNCFFVVGVFCMEIPTGAYADVLGRRNSFIAACFVLAASMGIYYMADSFWMCVLAELIGAAGSAFCSGSLEAWVVDSVKHAGMRGQLHSIFRREQYVVRTGGIVGSLLGGYIAQGDLALPWLYASVGLFALGIVALCIMREEYFERKPFIFSLSALRTIIVESIRYGVRRKSVLYVVIFGSLVTMCVQPLNMQWQLRLVQDFSFDTMGLSWGYVGISIFVMLGSFLSRKFIERVGNEKRALILSQAITTAGVLVAAYMVGAWIVLPAFLVHEIGRGMMVPLKRAYMNKRIPSKQRATILSFDSMVNNAGAFIGLVVGGWLAKHYSISTAWIVSGLALAITIPVFLKLKNGDG